MKEPHPYKTLSFNKVTFRFYDQTECSSVKRLLSQRFFNTNAEHFFNHLTRILQICQQRKYIVIYLITIALYHF